MTPGDVVHEYFTCVQIPLDTVNSPEYLASFCGNINEFINCSKVLMGEYVE